LSRGTFSRGTIFAIQSGPQSGKCQVHSGSTIQTVMASNHFIIAAHVDAVGAHR
jgi:hypothetical protein